MPWVGNVGTWEMLHSDIPTDTKGPPRFIYIYLYNIDLQQAGSQNKILHSDFLILILADAVAISP